MIIALYGLQKEISMFHILKIIYIYSDGHREVEKTERHTRPKCFNLNTFRKVLMLKKKCKEIYFKYEER